MAEETSTTPSSQGNVPPLPAPVVVSPRRQRLPGTYAGNYLQDDPNPAGGAWLLGLIFSAAFFFEAFGYFTRIFDGTGLQAEVGVMIRVGVAALALVLLWAGAGVVRWPLAAAALFVGLISLIQTVALSGGYYDVPPNAANYTDPNEAAILTHRIEALAPLALGFIYLGMSVCLVFSSNVAAFAKQQTTRDKALSVVPVVALSGLCLLGLFMMRPLCLGWRSLEVDKALASGDASLRALAEHWDYRTYDAMADPDYIAQYPVEAQKAAFGSVSGFGAVRRIETHSARVFTSLNRDGGGFGWDAAYVSHDTFERGPATVTFQLRRGLFSPWRIVSWSFQPG